MAKGSLGCKGEEDEIKEGFLEVDTSEPSLRGRMCRPSGWVGVGYVTTPHSPGALGSRNKPSEGHTGKCRAQWLHFLLRAIGWVPDILNRRGQGGSSPQNGQHAGAQCAGKILFPNPGWVQPSSGSCSREWVGWGFVESISGFPHQSRKESAQRHAALGLGYTEVQAEEVEASPRTGDGNGLEASTG